MWYRGLPFSAARLVLYSNVRRELGQLPSHLSGWTERFRIRGVSVPYPRTRCPTSEWAHSCRLETVQPSASEYRSFGCDSGHRCANRRKPISLGFAVGEVTNPDDVGFLCLAKTEALVGPDF
jgi:hypothetical protein